MTDPGGGYGWRSAEHLPRRRGGVMGWGQVARQADPLGEQRPLCLLLLPAPLEAFELRERAEDLLRAPGSRLDPPRMGYGRRLRGDRRRPGAVQARRMRLPGFPRLIVLFDPLQYPLARALTAIHPDAELWYGPRRRRREAERARTLHDLASERAAVRFERSPGPPTRPTGRCGSGWRRSGSRAGGSAPSA